VSAGSEPVFNVPRVITATLALLIAIHAVRELLLSDDENIEFLLLFAFIPVRYDPTVLAMGSMPGGLGAQVWTFVTYALIHGDLMHLAVNGVWLLAFGSPIARRFGALRFRYFGRRPLIEDNSVTSKPTTLVDLRVGYKFSEQARLWLDILNLFNNTGAHQIDYFYPSQLANETAPVYDVHFKPVEPLSVRLTLSMTF